MKALLMILLLFVFGCNRENDITNKGSMDDAKEFTDELGIFHQRFLF